LLAERCLPSVYAQEGVDPTQIQVLVVDDNADGTEYARIATAIDELRRGLGLPASAFPTALIRNARTRGRSGTGAWNTGLDCLQNAGQPPTWLAVLDDDDAFLPHHLVACLCAADDGVAGVFERLEWVRSHGIEDRPFGVEDLIPESFFVGNPGVQASNLFVRLDAILAIGGFDEALPNTTDRDLMIRLLRHVEATGQIVRALPSVGVRYYDDGIPRVNTDLQRKAQGLDVFYAKYAAEFSAEQLHASQERARALFGYAGYSAGRAPLHLLVGIIFRDAAATLATAVDSVLSQDIVALRVSILLVDDSSTDDWQSALGERLGAPGIHVRQVALRSGAKARNFVLDEVERAFPDVDYVCRLDADDVLAGTGVLRELSAILARACPDALLAGNLQRRDGVVLSRPNLATPELLEPRGLLDRLGRMADGDPTAELPSCNTVVRRGLPLRYPLIASAEDHWFTVALLLERQAWRVLVAPDLIYAVYRLRGGVTVRNEATEAYRASRRALLAFAHERLCLEVSHGSS
jgi:glycosyltransferase involved in cell wall biosynthesis